MFSFVEIRVSVVFRSIWAFRAFGSARVATNVKAQAKGRAWWVSTWTRQTAALGSEPEVAFATPVFAGME